TPSASPRSVSPSHSHNSVPKSPYHQPPSLHPSHMPDASSSHRSAFVPSFVTSAVRTPTSHKTSEYVVDPRIHSHSHYSSDVPEEARVQGGASSPWASHTRSDSDRMEDSSPQAEAFLDAYHVDHPMDVQSSPMVPEYQTRPRVELDHPMPAHDATQSPSTKLSSKLHFSLGKKPSKWGLSTFGRGEKVHQQSLPSVDKVPGASSNSTPSLKRPQSTSSDSPSSEPINGSACKNAKAIKKEVERHLREAEKQGPAMAEKTQREQARVVMQKRS
ncbi:hypothetical protein EDB19DRAFT_1989391, partial [Suillus lakei]